MIIKQDRLKDLEALGFWTTEYGDYTKSLKVSNINVSLTYGKFYVSIGELVFADFKSEITRIYESLLSDRYEVEIMIDILREKGMVKAE